MKNLNATGRVAELFEAVVPKTPQHQAIWEQFKATGIPDIRHEDWRYAKLPDVLEHFPFQPFDEEDFQGFSTEVPGESGTHILLQDGCWVQPSVATLFPKGVTVMPLAQGLQYVAERLPSMTHDTKDGLTLLNLAAAQGGVVIVIEDHVQLDVPLVIRDVAESAPEDFHNARIVVWLGENAKAQIHFSRTSVDGVAHGFTNQLWSIALEKSSALEIIRLEESGTQAAVVSSLNASVQAHAKLTVHTAALEGKFLRSNYHCEILGEQAEITLNGLHMPGENQYMDARVEMVHDALHTQSNQTFKSLAGASGQSVFSGKILVARGAQKTNAYQHHQGMLLDESAKIYTKPQLEIYADDVKCSHGATTGQLDEEALFYLRARGISYRTARKLLLASFCDAFTSQLPESSFADHCTEAIHQKLATYA